MIRFLKTFSDNLQIGVRVTIILDTSADHLEDRFESEDKIR